LGIPGEDWIRIRRQVEGLETEDSKRWGAALRAGLRGPGAKAPEGTKIAAGDH